jgi:1-acyl-sn-glycerol-3-phosphate acyltransferase
MGIFILCYWISTIIVPHSKERALTLRKNFLKFVALPILNLHIQYEGNPELKPALYISNHRSFADPLVICRHLDAFVIAKAEVSHYPIINIGAELSGVIWVDRNNKDSRTATREKLIEVITSGYNVLVFPEGTVGTKSSPLPFRPGTFLEAFENDFPIIPIAIEYQSAQDLWVKEKFIPQYFYQFSKWRTHIKVKYGNPIEGKDGADNCQKAYQWVDNELAAMQHRWVKWH